MFHLEKYALVAREYLTMKRAEGFNPESWDWKDDSMIVLLCENWAQQHGLEAEYAAFQEQRLGPVKDRQPLLDVDVSRTRRFYQEEKEEELCDCDGCKNYRARVKRAYPEAAAYLDSLGVDIAKPFHVSYVDLGDGRMLYIDACYILFGEADYAFHHAVGGVEVIPALAYPDPGVEEPHLVLEIAQLKLPCPEKA